MKTDKIVVITNDKLQYTNMLNPGIFLPTKSIYYCKGFSSEDEIKRLFETDLFGDISEILDPFSNTSESIDFLHRCKDVTYSAYIIKGMNRYYRVIVDVSKKPERLIKETTRIIYIKGHNPVGFSDKDFDDISRFCWKSVRRENMMYYSPYQKTPEELINELLFLQNDENTKWIFLFDDISLLKYYRDIQHNYLSMYPFANRCSSFTKCHDDDDTVYHLMMKGTDMYSRVIVSNVVPDGVELPVLSVDF